MSLKTTYRDNKFSGRPLECAVYVTDASGVQGPGEF